ncbi:MAG: copper homeostasis protein [Francisellaceae bacterium]|jgi:copper homeostasis protein
MMTIEVCVDNVDSVINAAKAGAHRLELCSALSAEGLTPTPGFVGFAKNHSNCSLQVMIRPRSGDFYYSKLEKELMLQDLKQLTNIGIDGFVIGALDENNQIDIKFLTSFLNFAQQNKLETTFHRAIDLTPDYMESLQTLCDLGFTRVLTSGQEKDVSTGIENIKLAQHKFGNRIQIMPGGGISSDNVLNIVNKTKVSHVHCSASSTICRDNRNKVFDQSSLKIKITNYEILHSIVSQL